MIHWIQQWHSFRKDSNDTPTEAIFLAYTKKCEQECIPVGCVPSAAVAVSPVGGGESASGHAGIPPGADPQNQASPWAAPLGPGTPPEQTPHGTRHCPPWDQAPPRDQAPRPEGGTPLRSRHPSCGQTHTCKNITFATSLRTVRTRNRNGC